MTEKKIIAQRSTQCLRSEDVVPLRLYDCSLLYITVWTQTPGRVIKKQEALRKTKEETQIDGIVMRNALGNFEGTVDVGGHQISNLRYADDIVLMASNMNELQQLLDKVREASEKTGLFLNTKKAKTVKIQRQRATNDDEHITVNGVAVENVKEFIYLGAVFANTYDDPPEIKRTIFVAKNATVALNDIWKD